MKGNRERLLGGRTRLRCPRLAPVRGGEGGADRLTATLAPLAERDGVRVNCVVPHWIETAEVRRQIAGMTPEERSGVPRLLQPSEVAAAVVDLMQDDALAGRVLVMWCGEEPYLLQTDRRD